MSRTNKCNRKAGRYRCKKCNRTCNDSIKCVIVETKDIYMGRIDKTKGTTNYFCTPNCCHIMYIETMIPVCKLILKEFFIIIQVIHCAAENDLREKLGDFKTWMLCLKMIKDMEAFYQAIVDGKCEYILHELKLYALHTDGLVLEEVHSCSKCMNGVLRMRTEIEHMNLNILGNR